MKKCFYCKLNQFFCGNVFYVLNENGICCIKFLTGSFLYAFLCRGKVELLERMFFTILPCRPNGWQMLQKQLLKPN